MSSEEQGSKKKTDDSKPNFIYTSANCDNLPELRRHYIELQTIEWSDVDQRYPKAERNHDFPDNEDMEEWLDVRHCLDEVDECIDQNKMKISVSLKRQSILQDNNKATLQKMMSYESFR